MPITFKKHSLFLLCATLLSTTLLSHPAIKLIAQLPIDNTHETVQSPENDDQLDQKQENDTQAKKPTILESWRKLITLRWKELSKTDAWNISAPVLGAASLGLLYYYWPKNVIANNAHHNPGHHNPGDGMHVPLHNNVLNPNNNRQQPFVPLTQEQRAKIIHLDENKFVIDDIQRNIALNMINYALLTQKTLIGHTGRVIAVATRDDKVITGSSDHTVKIWNINSGQLLRTLNGHASPIYSIKIKDNKIITRGDNVIKIWNIHDEQLIHNLPVYSAKSIEIKGDNIIIKSWRNEIEIYNIDTGRKAHTLADIDEEAHMMLGGESSVKWFNVGATVKIFPLSMSVNLNEPEFNDPNHALFWIKHNLSILQANLIARAEARLDEFFIYPGTDDAHIWITFPTHVRNYLKDHLNIRPYRVIHNSPF